MRVRTARVKIGAAIGLAIALVLSFVVLTACAPSSEDSAHKLSTRELPKTLREGASTTPSAPSARPAFLAYFLRREGLVPVIRRADGTVTLRDTLNALVAGPTADVAAAGLHSAVPTGSVLRADRVRGEVAYVELDPSLVTATPDEQLGALAQIVFTLTARPGVRRVQFLLAGKPVDVPRADKTLTRQPVDREDFQGVSTAAA
jgi:spore germination protein GerM